MSTAPRPHRDTSVTARQLRSYEERERAVDLYREVFGYGDRDPAVTPKLLSALERNGGSAIGAFEDDGALVGFTYGFIGSDGAELYHYSQAAVVARRAQGMGVGRVLKRAQATHAKGYGISAMRWAYDPLLARNAHFNLDVLGARGRWLIRDFYGRTEADGRSDRIVVEWHYDDPADQADDVDVTEAAKLPWGELMETENAVLCAIPADWAAVRGDAEHAVEVRDRVVESLERGLAGGHVLASCRRAAPGAASAVYVLRPEADR